MIRSVRSLWGEMDPAQTCGSGPSLRHGPVQSPRIPLLIAGLGRATLRHVAEYADAVNFPPVLSAGDALAGRPVDVLAPADVEQKVAMLATHCGELARPLASLIRSHMAPVVLAESPARVAEKLNGLPERRRQLLRFGIVGTPEHATAAYASLMLRGIDYFITFIVGNDTETLDLLAQQVRPALEGQTTIAG